MVLCGIFWTGDEGHQFSRETLRLLQLRAMIRLLVALQHCFWNVLQQELRRGWRVEIALAAPYQQGRHDDVRQNVTIVSRDQGLPDGDEGSWIEFAQVLSCLLPAAAITFVGLACFGVQSVGNQAHHRFGKVDPKVVDQLLRAQTIEITVDTVRPRRISHQFRRLVDNAEA